MGAGGSRRLSVRPQPPAAAPENPLRVGDAEADRLTTTQVIVAGSGETVPGAPVRAAWEYRGPLRATRRIDGRYGDVLDYTTRITFYAGSARVRIDHTLKRLEKRKKQREKRAHRRATAAPAPAPASVAQQMLGESMEKEA